MKKDWRKLAYDQQKVLKDKAVKELAKEIYKTVDTLTRRPNRNIIILIEDIL
jgi:hypothetical protein